MTSHLAKRVWEHREGVVDGFAKQRGVERLVWLEVHAAILEAIERERQIRKWHRDRKVDLGQASNPGWRGLFNEIATWAGDLDSRLRGNDVWQPRECCFHDAGSSFFGQ